MIEILSICGSLRAASSNLAALEAAALLAPQGIVIQRFTGLEALPHFNPDVEASGVLPAAVSAFRAQVSRVDGLLICTPEYAHGLAGAFKNGLDWLVGAEDFAGKPVAVINAAPRAFHAHGQLMEVLATMSAGLSDQTTIAVPIQGSRLDAAGIAAKADIAEPIAAMLAALGEKIEAFRLQGE